MGKLDFARALAQGLLCETPLPSGEGCGQCLACGWLAQGNHPDFRSVEPEALADNGDEGEGKGKKPSRQILIEQVRELAGLVNLSTHRNGMRVILIHPAEAMNVNAANALLKTLEEPPPHTLIILISHHAQSLLPTVRSRCRKVDFAVPPLEQSMNWLRAQGVADPAPLLAQAGNAPLAALALAADESQEVRRGFLTQLARPQALDPLGLAEKSEKMELAKYGALAAAVDVRPGRLPPGRTDSLPAGFCRRDFQSWRGASDCRRHWITRKNCWRHKKMCIIP